MKRTALRSRRVLHCVIGVVILTGCQSTVSGTPVKSGQSTSERSQDEKSTQLALTQASGRGRLYEYDDVPMPDACAIMTLKVIGEAGFRLGEGTKAVPEWKDLHFVANPTGSDADLHHTDAPTRCTLFEGSGSAFVFSIEKPPFSDQNVDTRIERQFAKKVLGEEEETIVRQDEGVYGHIVWTKRSKDEEDWFTAIADEHYKYLATVRWKTSETNNDQKSHDRLIDTLANSLSKGFQPQTTYTFPDEYAPVKPPCTLYTSEDFNAAFADVDSQDSGQVEESYVLERVKVTSGAEGGTENFQTSHHASTKCERHDLAIALAGTGGYELTATFKHYEADIGAKQDNDYSCSGDPKYKHPFGEPRPIRERLGDGYVCFISMGQYDPTFQFKVGRVVVELTSRTDEVYESEEIATEVLTAAARGIAARLPK